MAKAVNISPNYLSEKFRQVTGVNFVRYVARTRYENARVLLHDVDLRISEIAFATGFQSLSQFNRVFKKFSGKSPIEYRSLDRRIALGTIVDYAWQCPTPRCRMPKIMRTNN